MTANINAFFDTIFEKRDIPHGELKDTASLNEAMFTCGVVMLRDGTKIKNSNINELATLLWDMVHHKVVLTALTKVRVLTLSVVGDECTILIPAKWHEKVLCDPWFQLGALVFVASQVCDFYHFAIGKDSVKRARAWEAEFLLTLRRMGTKSFTANHYQRFILGQFGNGLDSVLKDFIITPGTYKVGTRHCQPSVKIS